jgi:hypothetical protein
MEIAIGITATVVLALLGVVWNLLNDKIAEHKDDCDKEIAKLWDQIGRDSNSGMRVHVHATHGLPEAFMGLDKRVTDLERGPLGDR